MSIILFAATFGAFYLCTTSLELINKANRNYVLLPSNILYAATLWSFYLCATSLELINKANSNYVSLPSLCNYFTFGVSLGMIMTLSSYILNNYKLPQIL